MGSDHDADRSSGSPSTPDLEIRRATHDDYDDVRSFTEGIWTDRGGDYLPDVYHDWIEGEGGVEAGETPKKTFVADLEGTVVGIVQAVLLSSDEAWLQGMRVDPAHRRKGVSWRLNEACFEWCREREATLARLMVFSWNAAGLGVSRAIGAEPITEVRWVHPDPDSDAEGPLPVSSDPTAAWRHWTHSEARDELRGLGLDLEQSWALREVTRADLERQADEAAVFAVEGDDGLSGMAYRSRVYERSSGGGDDEHGDDGDGQDDAGSAEPTTWAEYGVAAWDDVDAARSLFAAISRDAAVVGADETRVMIPETVGYVSDASYAGVEIGDEPAFVLGVDLAGTQ
ncbi:GNAT family N-acetyltransferase [Natrialbaceae archaeon GCM10025810]|uniref:GNAT family N-acetyltransferase n=1 Tax=Halovalidus salilacus TaxID=3075124 RepID=UPI00361BB892